MTRYKKRRKEEISVGEILWLASSSVEAGKWVLRPRPKSGWKAIYSVVASVFVLFNVDCC